MTVFSTEPLRPSDHPLLHTWASTLWGVRTANYSSSDKTVSLGITFANISYGTKAVVAKAGGTGQENIWFHRVLGSTLAGDRIDFSSLDPRSMFVGYSPTSPLGVKVNLGTGSVGIGSNSSSGGTLSWGCLVQNFEDVAGSAFHDILIGNTDSNKFLGGAGNDTLDGDAGDDTLDGGAGVDVLTGGSGNDRFILADRGDLNADSITDFKAYMVRSQPGRNTNSLVVFDRDGGGGIFIPPPPGGVVNPLFTTIENKGNTKLLRRNEGIAEGNAFVESGAGTPQEITVPWGLSSTGSDRGEWEMLAAEKIGDTNQVLWRNNTSSFLHIWNLDANWNWQASSGADGFNTPRAWELETIFQVDGNRDGITGAPFTTLEAQGDTKLQSRGDGKAFVEYGAGMRQEISSPWNSPAGSDSNEWQMLAAEKIAGTNQILWRNNTASFLHTWSLDANWNWQASSGADGFNTPRAWELETSFQVDGNYDGIIGAPFEDDGLILANRLDEGLVGASAAGIKGLTFSGGNGVGNTLAPTSFFKGAGMDGASFGAAAGIFVNTSSGDVFYNDAKEAGSYLIARLGAAGVAGISASDFLLG